MEMIVGFFRNLGCQVLLFLACASLETILIQEGVTIAYYILPLVFLTLSMWATSLWSRRYDRLPVRQLHTFATPEATEGYEAQPHRDLMQIEDHMAAHRRRIERFQIGNKYAMLLSMFIAIIFFLVMTEHNLRNIFR